MRKCICARIVYYRVYGKSQREHRGGNAGSLEEETTEEEEEEETTEEQKSRSNWRAEDRNNQWTEKQKQRIADRH